MSGKGKPKDTEKTDEFDDNCARLFALGCIVALVWALVERNRLLSTRLTLARQAHNLKVIGSNPIPQPLSL
jgi:hypothetical protein